MDLIPEIKKLVEAAEITATEKCIDAKAQWELLIREGHENSYAACVRWDRSGTGRGARSPLGRARRPGAGSTQPIERGCC